MFRAADLQPGIARVHQMESHSEGGALTGLVPYLAVPDDALTRLYVSPLFKSLVTRPVGQGRFIKDHDRWRSHLHPDDRESVLQSLLATRANREPFSLEYRLKDGDGTVRWVRDMGVYVEDPQREDLVIQGVMVDITREHELEERLESLESAVDTTSKDDARGVVGQLTRQMHDTLERAETGIYRLDNQGCVTYINRVALKLTGYERAAVLGMSATRFHQAPGDTPDDLDELTRELVQALTTGKRHHIMDATLWRADGRPVAVHCRVEPAGDGESVVTIQDATEHRSLATQLEYQATHDPLTGLFNRRELLIRLEQALHRARSRDMEAGLLYIDVDQFRVINDTSGHAAGDELLRQVSGLMTAYARPSDVVARLGGDEFAMILNNCTTSELLEHAETLRDRFAEFGFRWEDKTYTISTSIGIVPLNRESGNVISVMSAADTACNTAKERGRNRVHMFKQDDTSLIRRQGEMRWVARIHQAVREGQLALFAQPIEPVGEEARAEPGKHLEMLIKMHDGQGGLIAPGVFLPAAERYNLSATIDRWVVQHSFAWISDEGIGPEQLALCAINLSGHSVGDPTFLEYVVAQLKRHALPADRICFEITETVAIANLTQAREMMSTLGGMGCRFALDDFGSGMSSFGYLRTLPVDFLKIDGLFVKDIAHDPTDLALVRSINDIAHVMGKRTIAEFVESREILDLLKDMGVDYAQGHFLAEPVAVADLRI
ncbi:GGDEF domain-containing protein [Thioalkalivibrio denitrificans]|uniref:GGDEF domain-containing protein n=1 Tax=Thioalkalivibrio denitrificans TaxID=108003 RepID=A0A1V3NE76_9GAMM|nr:GGDEF domain-containing protein [Thioalkalivibrio denitrificans]